MKQSDKPVIYTGRVVRFDPVGRYGFLQCSELAGDTFFHFNSGERVMLNEQGEPIACAELRPEHDPYADSHDGSRIYFQLADGKEGKMKAHPWCYADDHDRLSEQASRTRAA